MIKVLLVGVGRWGANHLRVLSSLPIQLFVADLNPKSLELARKHGIPDDRFNTDYRAFAAQVDASVVVTPAQSHFPLCHEFLSAGKDVFVEKPITLVSSEAQKLAELAATKNRILQVGHIFRFDTASRWLHAAIRNKEFGELRLLRSNFSGFKRPRNDSGIVLADAIHFVDLYNYFLGQMPVSVTAIMRDFIGRGMEDASLISLEYELPEGKVWGLIETNYFLPGKMRELTVVGSRLTATCDFNVSQYKIRTFANTHVPDGANFKAEEGAVRQIECAPEEPLLAELRAFIDSVENRTPALANGRAGFESIKVIEAAMESARAGESVSIR